MKVVIGGSRSLPRGQAPRLLAHFLANLTAEDSVLYRKPVTGPPGPFERDLIALCGVFLVATEPFTPEPTPTTPGRASVYFRDIEMIEKADLVLLFFTSEEAVEGYSGTAHLMDKALDADRPVYAYAMNEDGDLSRVGEYDPSHLYADRVPAA